MALTAKRLAYLREYRRKNYERVRGYELKYQRKPEIRKRRLAYMKAYDQYHLHHQKMLTRSRTREAVRSGKLKRLPCEMCGNAKTHAHHTDYSKPFDVKWLCSKHHGEAHIKYREEHTQ